jgi:hypothetical protein
VQEGFQEGDQQGQGTVREDQAQALQEVEYRQEEGGSPMNRMLAASKLTLAALLAIAVFAPGASVAAVPAPSWSIDTISYATNFLPNSSATGNEAGPGYQILATNLGAKRTEGTFTIVDTLPAGVTLAPGTTVIGTFGRNFLSVRNLLTCETAGQVVTCTGASPGVGAGETAEVKIPVKLSSSLTGSVVNEVTISGGGSTPASDSTKTAISAQPAGFDFLPGTEGLRAFFTDEGGAEVTQAGAHPYIQKIDLGFPSVPKELDGAAPLPAGGGIRDVFATLPPGMVVNPSATPRCRESELESKVQGCPADTQVGIVRLTLGIAAISSSASPLYNMVPAFGTPAEFGLEILEGTYAHLQGRLNSEGDYELSAGSSDILAKVGIMGVQATLWGNPTAENHDEQRVPCLFSGLEKVSSCPAAEQTNTALVSMPTACSGPLKLTAEMDSWLEPGIFKSTSFETVERNGEPAEIEGCSALHFDPTIGLKPDTSAADSPSGLAVSLHVPQSEEFEDEETSEPRLSESTLRDAKVTLPAGMAVNPSAANGRGACTPAQIGLQSLVGQPKAVFDGSPAACPDSSKVGTVEVLTPLLQDETGGGKQVPHPIPGSIYLAQPYENPFGTLLAAYVAINDPSTGIVVKLAGKVEADPVTGQLTTTFNENPQLPFEDFKLNFFGGPRAALRSPVLCGTYASQSELTPWSGTAPVSSSDPFPISQGAGGQPCATSVSQLPNAPSFEAGTTSPLAGKFSPFVLRMKREDGSQEFSALNITMPPGLTGKLAGTPYCPEAALAAAALKTGREEQASPSCPAASEVGRVVVGAGSGPSPYFTEGKAYLAGPYKGDPLSIAIVTPAVAGPFDLGTVVVRSALHVDLFSAQITVKSDPLPTILKGIPLDVRSIAVEVGKPGFTLNPTSCEPMNVTGEAISTTGKVASLQSHFQVGGCKELGFKPKLKISLKGGTKRSDHPALKAVATFPTEGAFANVARAQVALPHSEFLDQGNLNNVCTQPQLKSRTCPAKSIYGKAKAWTPLLDEPLEGPVYLGVGFGHNLPDLVAELNGQIRVLVHGKVDTDDEDGIRNTFEAVPDAPVSKFVIEMQGGKKKGLLENSEDICRNLKKATVKFVAQNGKVSQTKEPIQTSCKGKKAGKKRK